MHITAAQNPISIQRQLEVSTLVPFQKVEHAATSQKLGARPRVKSSLYANRTNFKSCKVFEKTLVFGV